MTTGRSRCDATCRQRISQHEKKSDGYFMVGRELRLELLKAFDRAKKGNVEC
jgi:hypothetical protein